MEGERIIVGPAMLFTNNSRQLVKVGIRNIMVIKYKDQFYALDNACYHHGGPLIEGDIEDMEQRPCVVCPWHNYRITLDTGEGLYWGLDFHTQNPEAKATQKLMSKGVKQRTHTVRVEDGNVILTVRTDGPAIASDEYATMEVANQEDGMAAPKVGASGGHSGLHSGMRSGQVFAGMRVEASPSLGSDASANKFTARLPPGGGGGAPGVS